VDRISLRALKGAPVSCFIALRMLEHAGVNDLVEMTGYQCGTVIRALRKLRALGLVRRDGARGQYWPAGELPADGGDGAASPPDGLDTGMQAGGRQLQESQIELRIEHLDFRNDHSELRKAQLELQKAQLGLQKRASELQKSQFDASSSSSSSSLVSFLSGMENNVTTTTTTEGESRKSQPELRKSRSELRKSPIGLQKAPSELQKTPNESQRAPIELQKAPIELQKSPSDFQKSPSELQKSPSELQKSQSELRKSPFAAAGTRAVDRAEDGALVEGLPSLPEGAMRIVDLLVERTTCPRPRAILAVARSLRRGWHPAYIELQAYYWSAYVWSNRASSVQNPGAFAAARIAQCMPAPAAAAALMEWEDYVRLEQLKGELEEVKAAERRAARALEQGGDGDDNEIEEEDAGGDGESGEDPAIGEEAQ